MDDEELLAEQIRYYDRRAPVYEQLYFLQGPHAAGDPEEQRTWRAETAAMEDFVRNLPSVGSCLELACGNGLWTRFLVDRADELVAVDASPRMLARNRAWVDEPRIRYVEADLFEWEPVRRFDLVFAGFFLSHVPPSRWETFSAGVARWLAPGGTFAFVDDVWGPGRPRSSQRVAGAPAHAHVRHLDGSTFTIVKRFFRPEELVRELGRVGLRATVRSTGEWFLVGTARLLPSETAEAAG